MKNLTLIVFISCMILVSFAQQSLNQQQLQCSSRIISLIPKTLKYHNQINNTKQLSCKTGEYPSFVALDQRCYLIINPSNVGDFRISINITVLDSKKNGSQISQTITVNYILSINKIRYTTFDQQQVEFDISLNRIIDIEAFSNSWLLKPGQQFFAQFTTKQNSKIYDKVYYQFVGLPDGLKGNQINGVVQGNIQVPPGYYSFGVRVFDLQGNSQTLEATILVHDQHSIIDQEEYEDQETLKSRLNDVDKKIAQTASSIDDAKRNIEKYLQLISSGRAQQSDLVSQQRKLQGADKSLAYAADWAKNNLDNNKQKLQLAQSNYNKSILDITDAKRTYQTSIFSINQKQSQIQKQQLEADRKFQMYLSAQKSYTIIRIQLDDCERKNKKIADEAINNLKQIDRANFVQNLQNIIQNT